jgi:RND superfamily putative drug exporter
MSAHSSFHRTIRALAVPIILIWVVYAAATNLLVPQVEKVGMANAVSMSPQDAPAVIAAKRMGEKFQESTSDSIAMVVLVGDQPLGEDAHRYYDDLVGKFEADTTHVEHVANFWGDMITAAGVQSSDGKAAYVQLNLAGDQGSTQGNKSVDAIREIISDTPPPAGLHAYVTGPAPLTTDSLEASDRGMIKMTVVTMIVITIMLALVYRSVSTVLLILAVVGIEMGSARGTVAVVGKLGLMDFSTFSVPLMTALSIAAGTDYAIFLIGRYHEARQNGEDPESAYYSAFHGVGHVILGSGLTIAGAMLTLRLTRLSYFNSLAYPSALALIIVVAAAMTVAPAILVVGSRFGLLDPKRMMKTRGWRKVGTATVRWPKPILAAATSVVLLGILAMIGYKTSYDDRRYIPADVPANVGYAAAEQHFSTARLNPDIMTIESDHDMRNPTDMIVLDRITKALFRIKGIAMVQGITRPLGSPIAHSSIPYQISMSSVPITQNLQTTGGRHQRDVERPRGDDRLDDPDAEPDDADVGGDEQHRRLRQRDGRLRARNGRIRTAQRRRYERHEGHARSDARQPRQFRRRGAPVPQLLLLGTALRRHHGVRRHPIGIRSHGRRRQIQRQHGHPAVRRRRHDRRHGPDGQRHGPDGERDGRYEHPVPAAGRPVPADHRHRHHHAGHPADHPQQLRRPHHPDAADDRHRHRHG